MGWLSSERWPHEFGYLVTYSYGEGSYGEGDVVVLDNYVGQYSLHWSTRFGWIDFSSLWLQTGIDDREAFIQRVGVCDIDKHMAASELAWYANQARRGLLAEPVSLIRLWLREASVTWQLLPTVGRHCAVVGVASDCIDVESISKYFRATATARLVRMAEDLPHILSDVDRPRTHLRQLSAAADIFRKPEKPHPRSRKRDKA